MELTQLLGVRLDAFLDIALEASPEVAGSELPATEVTDHRPTAAGDGLAESAAGLVGEVEPDLVLGGSEWVAVADPAGAADVGGSGETGSRPSSGDLAPGASGYSSGRPPAPTRRRWPWLAALLALLAAVAAAAAYAGYTYLGLGGDEDALGVSAATTSTVGSTTTSALFEVADAAALLIVVELGDPLGASTATGQAELSFDVGQGEICYAFAVDGVGSPYGAYLHAGRAGTEGGIVVDFGLMEGSPEVACVPVARVDVEAILADRAGYYVEIHDPDGVTIRSQLGPGGNESEVDPKGGGALVVIEAGTLTLIGDVPDEQAAADLRASFADIDLATTEIVDQLRVVEGAPPPSGRILVDETILFDFDSARMLDPDNTVLQDLATIFDARPGWAITIVGHTDSSGPAAYNLELSLRRADAVRDALVAAGVDEESLSVEGAGDTEPIADNDTAEGRARNRRIELEVTPA
jgi:outer membrane protein OmpA-like peptidoglycan-associated protein